MNTTPAMPSRYFAVGGRLIVRRLPLGFIRKLHQSPTGGLLRTDSSSRVGARRLHWLDGSGFHHAVITRNASFVRLIPRLMIKVIRIPALFGSLAIGVFAWVQYQANQASTYALELFNRTKDAVGSTTSALFGSAMGVAQQTYEGWEHTKEQASLPEWLKKILRIGETVGSGESRGPGGNNNAKKSRVEAAVAGGVSAAAYGLDTSGDDDPRSDQEAAKDDQMMVLTKKMIEIRNILQKIGQSSSLTLPSIVVIGSQSSGKSSVLEAIVGHEFLPKGSNMVTRRPIELTLVNTPNSKEEYGEFSELGLHRVKDFTSIQRTLTDFNLAVTDADCISEEPIRLSIYSPNIPDLSLIDLPGYIQVVGQDQPLELRRKISELCDKYIQPPNIILAISAADVDLANSAALQASRRIDPRGERTIGVVTKMDLIDPEKGATILGNTQYPLRLGYVGVVAKAPQSPGLFKLGSTNLTSAIIKHENSFFSAHPLEFDPASGISVGTTNLRKKLMHVLEQTMSSSLQSTSNAIRQELEEATYEFKVQYNDRPLSAESYLAESLDAFKHSFKQFAEEFGRPQIRELLKNELDQRVLDLLAARYWNKPIADLSPVKPEADSIRDLPKSDPFSQYWRRQLDASTSALTKSGIGRLATTVVARALKNNVDHLLQTSNFGGHPFAKNAILDAAATILDERFYSTSDQVENCIKPFKFEIDVEEREWSQSKQHVGEVLKKELRDCESALSHLESSCGGRKKMREVMNFITKAKRGDFIEDDGRSGAGGFSAALLRKGREAVFLRDRADILNLRMTAILSKQCASIKNKYFCPEIFLDAAASKLASTAVLFLNVELLSEFYYNFPRELDLRLGRHLSPEEVERFATEDPKIRRHLEVIRRKELLEMVLEKLDSLKQLEGREHVRIAGWRKGTSSVQERGRWGLI